MIETLPEKNAEIAALIGGKLGVGGDDTLQAKLKKGGKRLPHKQRQQAQYLAEQEQLWAHPRMRRTIDAAKAGRAQTELRRYLEQLDRSDIFMGRVIGILAPLMFNILLIFIAWITWLVMTGRL